MTDPDTSQAAAVSTEARQAIKIHLLAHYAIEAISSGRGMTDEEAMNEAGYDLADDGHRRRCSDLRREGFIAQVVSNGQGVKRFSERTGKDRMVCTITEAGITALQARKRAP
jgi:hypothetical protein